MSGTENIGPAAIQGVRPNPTQNPGVTPVAPPSNRLSAGVQLTSIAYDKVSTVSILLTAQPDLVGDQSGEEVLLRNLYRASRNALVGNSLATRVNAFIESRPNHQSNGGVAVTQPVAVMEGTLDRVSAMSTNPDTEAVANLKARLQNYHWIGQRSSATNASNSTSPDGNSGNTGASQ